MRLTQESAAQVFTGSAGKQANLQGLRVLDSFFRVTLRVAAFPLTACSTWVL